MAWKKRPFTLYWSSLVLYESCPQKFLWSRGWGQIDVGGGPGRKKPVDHKRSEHHALLGTVIQAALEWMYEQNLYLNKGLKPLLVDRVAKEFRKELDRRYIDYREAPSDEEMMEQCEKAVMGYLRTFAKHKLYGPYAKPEVNLLAYINKYNPIGGRPDVIVRREDTGITIVDGKNSKEFFDPKKGGPYFFTDPDQLRWYALCFYLSYKRLPDRLMFVYYRYPFGYTYEKEAERYRLELPDAKTDATRKKKEAAVAFYSERDPATGICEVPFTMEDIKGLAHRAVNARKGMNKEQFSPTPSPNECRFCDYEMVCPARQAQKEKNRGNREWASDRVRASMQGTGAFKTLEL